MAFERTVAPQPLCAIQASGAHSGFSVVRDSNLFWSAQRVSALCAIQAYSGAHSGFQRCARFKLILERTAGFSVVRRFKLILERTAGFSVVRDSNLFWSAQRGSALCAIQTYSGAHSGFQ